MGLAIILFISCAGSKNINLSDISLGMTKKEVIERMKKKPDNLIGAKKYPEGTLEVLQFTKYDALYHFVIERYWLYFWNDKLSQWGRPGDWKKEADRIYEFRER